MTKEELLSLYVKHPDFIPSTYNKHFACVHAETLFYQKGDFFYDLMWMLVGIDKEFYNIFKKLE